MANSSSKPQVIYLKDERLIIKFDPDRNETSVFIAPHLRVNPGYSESIGLMAITAGYVFAGHTKTSRPQSVLLRFTSISSVGRQFADEKELNISIVVDEESLFTGRLERLTTGKSLVDSPFYDKSAPNYREEYDYYEFLGISIPIREFHEVD